MKMMPPSPESSSILAQKERANAQSSEMVHQFDEALERANQGYDVKVLIIKANGKGFFGRPRHG